MKTVVFVVTRKPRFLASLIASTALSNTPSRQTDASWRSRSAVHVHGPGEVRRRLEVVELLLHAGSRWCTGTRTSCARTSSLTRSRGSRGGSAARRPRSTPSAPRTPRSPRPPAPPACAAQHVLRVLDLAAARALQVALEQRLQLDEQRELLRAASASAPSGTCRCARSASAVRPCAAPPVSAAGSDSHPTGRGPSRAVRARERRNPPRARRRRARNSRARACRPRRAAPRPGGSAGARASQAGLHVHGQRAGRARQRAPLGPRTPLDRQRAGPGVPVSTARPAPAATASAPSQATRPVRAAQLVRHHQVPRARAPGRARRRSPPPRRRRACGWPRARPRWPCGGRRRCAARWRAARRGGAARHSIRRGATHEQAELAHVASRPRA